MDWAVSKGVYEDVLRQGTTEAYDEADDALKRVSEPRLANDGGGEKID